MTKTFRNRAADWKALQLLPLFSSLRLPLAVGDLHETFLPQERIESVKLPGRMRRALEALQVSNLGGLLLIPARDLLRIRKVGLTTLRAVQRAVRRRILGSVAASTAVSASVPRHEPSPNEEVSLENPAEMRGALRRLPLFCSVAPVRSPVRVRRTMMSELAVTALNLPARALTAFRRRGIRTLGELLMQPGGEMPEWPGFGRRTLRGVRHAIKEIFLERDRLESWVQEEAGGSVLDPVGSEALFPSAESAHGERVRLESQPPTREAVHRLPLFLAEGPTRDPARLHPAYCAKLDITALNLPARALHALESRGIQTLGELLMQPGWRMLEWPGFGRGSLSGVRHAIEEAILEQGSPKFSLDHSSFPALLRTYARSAGVKSRDFEVFAVHEGLDDGHSRTLARTGGALGLTRERVRQIRFNVTQLMRHPAKQQRLHRFWSSAREILARYGGLMRLEDLADRLAARFGWPSAPPLRVLKDLLTSRPEFQPNDPESVRWVECPCLECDRVVAAAGGLLPDLEFTPVFEAAGALYESVCRSCKRNATPAMSEALFHFVLRRAPAFQDHARIESGMLYSVDEWTLRHGPIAAAVTVALKRAREPKDLAQLRESLREYRDMGAWTEYALLAAVERAAQVLPWGRGIYIHQDYAATPQKLIDAVYGWAERRLAKGAPFVSVGAAFKAYETRCRKNGVPNETALYSCLRTRDHRRIGCPGRPILCRKDAAGGVPSIRSLVESYLAGANGYVLIGEARKDLVETIGLKDRQFSQMLAASDNILRVDGGRLIHRDRFRFERRRFRSILDPLRSTLSRGRGRVSADEIYQDHAASCARLAIEGPLMLYSILRTYCSEEFSLPGYPWISLARTSQGVGVFR